MSSILNISVHRASRLWNTHRRLCGFPQVGVSPALRSSPSSYLSWTPALKQLQALRGRCNGWPATPGGLKTPLILHSSLFYWTPHPLHTPLIASAVCLPVDTCVIALKFSMLQVTRTHLKQPSFPGETPIEQGGKAGRLVNSVTQEVW